MNNFRLLASLAAMLAVGIGLIFVVLWQLGYLRQDRQWTIATGDESGNYHQLGKQLGELLNVKLGPRDTFGLLPSAGSQQNIQLLTDGEADFAFVQSNAEPTEHVRLVATLYDEVLHVLVRAELIDSLMESLGEDAMPLELLESLDRVSLGPLGSGTSQVAEMLLDHFEVKLKAPPLRLASSELKAKFAAGELDAAFVLSAPGSDATEELLDEANVLLLSLGSGPLSGSAADGFATLHPAFQPQLIPRRMYGRQPRQAVQTIGVSALLVAADTTDFNVVRQVTRRLFSHRNQLVVGEETPLSLSNDEANPGVTIPFHPGAEAFYHRENPSFLVVYAEVIALGITVLVGVWSLARLFLRWLADVKKERIDRFYREVREAAKLSGTERLEQLQEIHDRAFDQLMTERLIANESFVIFHDYLLDEIRRAERNA